MRWTRQQYLALMVDGSFERPMFTELFGPLIGLEAQWQAQGATPEEISLAAFEWDYVPIVNCGGSCGPLGSPSVVLEETPTHRVERDYLGRTMMLDKRTATIALPQNFPVKSMDDWLKLKPLFEYRDGRIDWEQLSKAKQLQRDGALVLAGIPGAYDMVRELMGEEMSCLAYYDQPELLQDILDTLHATAKRVLEQVSEHITIDQLSVHEDLAGRSGPLVGPSQVTQYFKPYFSDIWQMLSSRGTRMFAMDTDGNVNPIIDVLLDCGITEIFPMEPAAGMDVVDLHEKYGLRLAWRGGIDKHALRQDKQAIEKELAYKLQPIMRDAGHHVFALDHRIPDGVSIEHYRYYVDLGREMLGLPARSGKPQPFHRMAF
jgi:uroporphyrinogen-III decarboxylase